MSEMIGAPVVAINSYDTMEDLRLAHLTLMDRNSQLGSTSETILAADIKTFTQRVTATGNAIEDVADRREAQGILDYWSAELLSMDGVDLRTWRQPRLNGFDGTLFAKAAGESPKTVTGLHKFHAETRQLIRIGALARQWKTGGKNEGYLLTGDALTEALPLKGQDADIDVFLQVSEESAQKSATQKRTNSRRTMAILGLAAVSLLISTTLLFFTTHYLIQTNIDLNQSNEQLTSFKSDAMRRMAIDQLWSECSAKRLVNTDLQTKLGTALIPLLVVGQINGFYLGPVLQGVVDKEIRKRKDRGETIILPEGALSSTYEQGSYEIEGCPSKAAGEGELPDLSSLNSPLEKDGISAVRKVSLYFAERGHSEADKLKLASDLVERINSEELNPFSLDGRHLVILALFLVPENLWEKPGWSGLLSKLQTNIEDLDKAIAEKSIDLKPSTLDYVEALHIYLKRPENNSTLGWIKNMFHSK
jgi:hypothetical protein